MIINIDKEIVQEIIEVSNHNTEESVMNAIEVGALEVFQNKEKFLDAGWSFDDENHYAILSGGKVVYFE